MIDDDLENYRADDYVLCKCDDCGKRLSRLKKGVRLSRMKNEGKDRCSSCSAKAHPRPQCSKSYWENPEIKKRHGASIRASRIYYEAISHRDMSGEKNGMTGKHHSVETVMKMSRSRKGKIGVNATAWKGGKTSLNKRVKSYITRSGWYKGVFERDNWICQECGSKKILDGHHIKAFSVLIKEALKDTNFETDDEKYLYLISREEIVDVSFKNGITLCRVCHGKAHGRKWGSHEQ